MNYLSDKVNSLTGEALSGVNEMRRKWKQSPRDSGAQAQAQSTSAIETDEAEQSASTTTRSAPTNTRRPPPSGAHYYATRMTSASRSPLAAGTPFGGDSFTSAPPPPPIGFRTDLLPPPPLVPPSAVVVEGPSTSDARPQSAPRNLATGSSESLYQADAWARLWFPRVMLLCLLRMLLFIRKVYEDFHATQVYSVANQTGFLLISALSLLLPTLVFTLYRVARYLQLVLPDLREAKAVAAARREPRTRPAAQEREQTSAATSSSKRNLSNDDEAQLTRALMTGSPESVASAGEQLRGASPSQAADRVSEEGLVTARQSPAEQFHDSQDQPQPAPLGIRRETTMIDTTMPAGSARSQQKLESLNVDKLGDLPDRDTVRVVVGASEQFLHGILFVFWQLKRQVDVLGYLVERACLWRKPAEREREELARLRTSSDGLEWFQDFYAAFLAILAQVFMLSAYWSSNRNSVAPVSGPQLSAATSALPLGDGSPSPVSESARILGSLLGTQGLTGGASGRDVLLVSELVVSSAVILSLLICVRRRDDGPLTLGLSMLGWGSLFAARIIAIGLAFVHIGWHIMAPLVTLHVLAITAWLYHIALASHNDAPSERQDEAQWDAGEEVDHEGQSGNGQIQGDGQPAEQVELTDKRNAETQAQAVAGKQVDQLEANKWSLAEHLALLSQILILFAIPSLFYWPIMFNLKLHLRVFKYLVLILIQNFLLIPAVWMTISGGHSQVVATMGSQPTPGQLYLLGAVGACSVVGFIFISLYVACKPSLTEYFARADELFNEADQSGIYYEFCSRVFKMPDLSQTTFRRLMDQSEEIVEERYELVREVKSNQVSTTATAT